MKCPGKPRNHSPTKRRRSATVTHDVRDKKIENHPTPPDGFLPKAVAPEVMHRAGAGASPNQLGSPTDDFAQGGLIPKAGSNSLGGTKTCSAADPKVPAMSSPGAVPNTPQISPAMAKKINDDIKYQLMKEVRKFGRKYERIFTLLEEVQGPLAVKKQFVEFTIKEAARFKRGVLIQQLEKVLEKIESCRLKKVNHQKSK
ncbi:integrator complex subunit 6-like [Ailuropoda melanoleuca]|uniref:integrator complex subunit 6-like n=1 Tax=Ailuropoda melanoleuca TaxID=9646 RepID=UPI001494D673|nr:integrator complex subunit 6-like [Ailuropoda melanoleuca]